mmetsp:Transcript_19085/g.53180  ORF Transcript_19085/g.53180 Transcript_19085/m.53180 type:complete len:779 (+) Transcript_19085:187-2523(+)
MSSISQQAVEAQELAVKEVARLLQRPEDLQRLPALLQEYRNRQLANQLHLSASIQGHVDAAKSGMEQLQKSQVTLSSLQATFAAIVDLCAECDRLIEHQEKIRLLSTVNTNLTRVVQDVEGISAIPAKANCAIDLLNNNQLAEAYQELAELESMSKAAEAAMQSRTTSPSLAARSGDLEVYFKKVQETSKEVEVRLWKTLRDFVALGKQNPALLVSVVRIIEMQEIVDAQQAGKRDGGAGKGYREKALSQMASAVADAFAGLLEQCSMLSNTLPAAADSDEDDVTTVTVNDVLAHADELLGHMADVYDYVTPCFPPDYAIFEEIWSNYHRQFGSMLNMIGSKADDLGNSDILRVLGWVTTYTDTAANLGIEEEELQFNYSLDSETPGLAMLVEKYTERVEAQIAMWFRNIVASDLDKTPTEREDGRLWTPGAIDFFRLVNEQVAVVQEITSGYLLHRVAESSLQQVERFLEAHREALGKPDQTLEQLAARINNCLDCYEQCIELADSLENALDEQYRGNVDVDAVGRGFLEVAKGAVEAIAEVVLSDEGVKVLLGKVYITPEWLSGSVTGTLVATINDYFADLQSWVDASFFKRISIATLQALVGKAIRALLKMNKVKITDEFIQQMEEDEEIFSTCFFRYLKEDKVCQVVQELSDMRDLVSSDSVEAYVLSYTNLLQVNTSLTPAQLEKLMQARTDMSKQDINEVMATCRDIYVGTQRKMGSAGDAPMGKLSGTPGVASRARSSAMEAAGEGRGSTLKKKVSGVMMLQRLVSRKHVV